jgi:hypothetical protein
MSDEIELRASDDEREQIVTSLRDAAANGRLTLEEFSERVETVYGSRTRGELEEVTRDLPAPAARSRKGPKRLTLSIFGGSERKGRWRVPRRSIVVALFGGTDLDLRQAELDSPTVTIFSFCMFGGTDFYVPEGVEVDLRGFALFGGNDEHGVEGHLSPAAPLVRVIAFTLFGGLDVWHVPAGSSGRRRELRRAARRRELGS